VPGVAHPTAGLHRTVGGIAGQTVGSVVTHGNEVRHLHVVLVVERPCCVTHHR
jgi:hypothetical protein